MDPVLQDLRFALRLFTKHPGFAAVACLTLALGIGANTAVFSVIDAVILRPLPFRDPDRLVWGRPVWRSGGGQQTGFVSAIDFVDFRRQNRSFEQFAAISGSGTEITGMCILTGVEGSDYVACGEVSSNFFEAFGITPLAGRTFTAEDETRDPPQSTIISFRLWQRRFGGQPVLGKVLTVDGAPAQIVGVMPASFEFPRRAELWVPLALAKVTRGTRPRVVQPIGRLKTSRAEAQADLDAISASLARQYPATNTGKALELVPLDDVLRGGVRAGLFLLFGAAALVLLIAVSNVANLQLVRASGRTREIVIRASLGASPGRLVRQLLAENIVLSLSGAAAGAVLARWTLPVLLALNPAATDLGPARISPSVLAFTALIAVLSGILFGFAPARDLLGRDLAQTLRQSGRNVSRVRTRTREVLVCVQVGLAFVLLSGAALLIASLVSLQHVDPGFNPHGIASALVILVPSHFPDYASLTHFQRDLLERTGALPGVRSAAIISHLPIRGSSRTTFVVREDRRGMEEPAMVEAIWLSPGALPALQVPLLKGRWLTEQEAITSSSAVIVNEALVRRFFGTEDPVGKRLFLSGALAPPNRVQEIVGVVRDARHVTLDAPPAPAVYIPSLALRWGYLMLRSSGDPASLFPAIRRELQRLDRDHPIAEFRTMDDIISESLAQPRFRTVLLGVFGGFALLLAAIGLYGVISYSVAQRNHELAVRVAMGASGADLMRVVVLHGLALAATGVAGGFPFAVGLGRALSAFLFGVSPGNPWLYAGSVAALSGVAVLATFVPALRAMKTDPIAALRQE